MTIHIGDCLEVMRDKIDDDSIDLIVTSPPYADRRKNTYGGVSPDEYVNWFSPIAQQIKRVMKPTGSFILNIKEQCSDGERTLYVYDLVSHLKRELGFRWVDEFCWHKTKIVPSGHKNRFKDGWERIYHFTKEKHFKIDKTRVKVPAQPSTLKRLKTGEKRGDAFDVRVTTTGSNFRMVTANASGDENGMVFPSNVLTLSAVCHNTGHSAAFPTALPEWFIKILTDEGDMVLDPFVGSGTTYYVARHMGRVPIGIDIHKEYLDIINDNMLKYENRMRTQSKKMPSSSKPVNNLEEFI